MLCYHDKCTKKAEHEINIDMVPGVENQFYFCKKHTERAKLILSGKNKRRDYKYIIKDV